MRLVKKRWPSGNLGLNECAFAIHERKFVFVYHLFEANPPGFAVEFECDTVGKSDRFSVAIAP